MSLSSTIRRTISTIKEQSNGIYLVAWGSILLNYWRGINNHLPVLNKYTDELEITLVVVPLILGLPYLLRKIKVSDFIFVMVCALIYTLNIVLYIDNADVLEKRAYNFLCLVLPYYLIGVSLDLEKLLKPFYYISVTAIFFAAFYGLIYAQSDYYQGELSVSDYNMEAAYNILPHVLLVSWIALKKFNVWTLSIMILGVGMIIAYGTRGPLVCIIIFIAIYLLFYKNIKYRRILQVSTIGVSVIIINFIDPIMMVLQLFFAKIGMSTRIFDYFLSDKITQSHGRDMISNTLNHILSNDESFLGYGLLGSYKYVNTYPHNIVLEFLFSFGKIIGPLLLLVIAILIISATKISQNSITKVFILLLVCASIIKLFMSGTFLDDSLFFMLIGFCVQSIRCRNNGIVERINKKQIIGL